MSLKLKVLGMGLLAVMATSAFAVMNAGAASGGHFTSSVHTHTIIKGEESGTHRLHFTPHGKNELIGCNTATYEGIATGTTVTQIDISPSYGGCTTTSNGAGVTVTPNGCTYRFTIQTAEKGFADLVCPGAALEIHHPNCTITVNDTGTSGAANQTLGGIRYTTDTTSDKKHSLTLHVNVTFNTEYHGGICIFLGTHQLGELNGSVTVRGTDTAGNNVDITAT